MDIDTLGIVFLWDLKFLQQVLKGAMFFGLYKEQKRKREIIAFQIKSYNRTRLCWLPWIITISKMHFTETDFCPRTLGLRIQNGWDVYFPLSDHIHHFRLMTLRIPLWMGFVFFLGSDSFARNEIETQLKFIKMWGVRRTSETVWLMRATAINYCSYCSAKPARSVICQETLSTCNVPLARSSDTLWFVFVFLQTHVMIRL